MSLASGKVAEGIQENKQIKFEEPGISVLKVTLMPGKAGEIPLLGSIFLQRKPRKLGCSVYRLSSC